MEVSLRLIQAGGTIVYARDALVKHVPETGTRHFLAKRRRDARAHVRIVRHHPKRRRAGPGFDFLGSSKTGSWNVAAVDGDAAGQPSFLTGLASGENFVEKGLFEQWQVQLMGASLLLFFFTEVLLWRGRFGVVNREVMRSTSGSKLAAFLGIRRLTFRWSLALWQGLLLGCLDALLGRNGTAAEGSVNLLIAGRSSTGMVQSKAGGHQRDADGVNADVNPSLVQFRSRGRRQDQGEGTKEAVR